LLKDSGPRTKEVLSYKTENNILWIDNKSCECYGKEKVEEFNQSLSNIKNSDEKIIVIDAASNGGGTDFVTNSIMQSLGADNQSLFGYIDLCFSRTKKYSSKDELLEKLTENYKKSTEINTPYIANFVEPRNYSTKHWEKIICIMQDRKTNSAGETYNAFANYDNLIILGDYTHGGQHFGNMSPLLTLNNSGIQTVLGGTYFYNSGDELIETKGYEPDIFLACDAKDNQTAVKNFIEKNL